MSSWWRVPFVLVLLSALVLLVVIPVTVEPAVAGIQVSGISSSSFDLADDLDDTFDLMLVDTDFDMTPETSRPLPLAPGLAGPRAANSLDRPPDRSPPARRVRPPPALPELDLPSAARSTPAPSFSIHLPPPALPSHRSARPVTCYVNHVLLRVHSRSYLPPLTAHRENASWLS
jgi:hypothetical protein